MADKVVIVDEESLTYTPDGRSETVVLSKWICDKHYDRLIINNAYGEPIVIDKISVDNPIEINGSNVTDITVARETIGANW